MTALIAAVMNNAWLFTASVCQRNTTGVMSPARPRPAPPQAPPFHFRHLATTSPQANGSPSTSAGDHFTPALTHAVVYSTGTGLSPEG